MDTATQINRKSRWSLTDFFEGNLMQKRVDTTTIDQIQPGVAVPNAAWLNDALADIEARQQLPGYVYLLHLAQPIGQPQTAEQRAEYGLPPRQVSHYVPRARHYLGWCKDVAARIQAHQGGYGARFMRAAAAAGIEFDVVRVWLGGRDLERRLKNQKNSPRLCPLCNGPVQLSMFELTPAQIEYELIGF
jgi:hypothetical protein